MKNKSAGYWLAVIGEVILAVAMFLYLGMHSLNFFSWTFKGDQQIFSWLGLFTTSGGMLIWLAVLLWKANDGLEKVIALLMLSVSLLGEFVVAAFDMYLNISETKDMASFTVADIRTMTYVVAGLALLNGLALVVMVANDVIIAMFEAKPKTGAAVPPAAPVSAKPSPAPFPLPAPVPSLESENEVPLSGGD